jgi:hypothetical protein
MQPRPSAAGMTREKKPKKPPLVIGWREIVTLPDLGLEAFRAKIDTGARTTALHASHIATCVEDGAEWVTFRPPRIGPHTPKTCRARVADRRQIKNTSGRPEERIVIRTHLHIAARNFLIDVSLADRADMRFPMIIGRSAIRNHRLLVDSGRSWLTRPSPLTTPQAERESP